MTHCEHQSLVANMESMLVDETFRLWKEVLSQVIGSMHSHADPLSLPFVKIVIGNVKGNGVIITLQLVPCPGTFSF